ncbi:MAG: flavin-nucleotide-binding protein [Novosphingobium sp.]|nr:flavin-nucleotide-binding protein [Novosphingobium sp.]
MTGAETSPPSPFHSGERLLQERLGLDDRMAAIGPKAILPRLTPQLRDFFAILPFAIVGTVDDTEEGSASPWVSVVHGPAGFITCPDPTRLSLSAKLAYDDPAAAGVVEGAAVALLGICPHTRRRNRVNGRIEAVKGLGFEVSVAQAFGNCPRFISPRRMDADMPRASERSPAHSVVLSGSLDAASRALISRSDTFFVSSFIEARDAGASDRAARQVDVSHRGGEPGFVAIERQDTLLIPDFAGNRYFNTLGNFVLNPVAGLLFIDFATGDMLHLTGTVEFPARAGPCWRGHPPFAEAERFWRFTPRKTVMRRAALPLVATD